MDRETYKITELENGDLIMEKFEIDKNIFTMIKKDNGKNLLKQNIKEKISNIENLKKYDFKKSEILKCLIDDDEISKNKYKHILENVYKIIGDGTKIIKNTKLNIKTTKKIDEGFYYLDNIGISIQGVDSNKSIYEIVSQCSDNEINIDMEIKLQNGLLVEIKF